MTTIASVFECAFLKRDDLKNWLLNEGVLFNLCPPWERPSLSRLVDVVFSMPAEGDISLSYSGVFSISADCPASYFSPEESLQPGIFYVELFVNRYERHSDGDIITTRVVFSTDSRCTVEGVVDVTARSVEEIRCALDRFWEQLQCNEIIDRSIFRFENLFPHFAGAIWTLEQTLLHQASLLSAQSV